MSTMIISLKLFYSSPFPQNPHSLFLALLSPLSASWTTISCLLGSLSPSPSGPRPATSPLSLLPCTTSLHQDQPPLNKGCCHREIAGKYPGGMHQLLSYRDVKCFKLLTQTGDPDSRTTRLSRCHEALKEAATSPSASTSIYSSN